MKDNLNEVVFFVWCEPIISDPFMNLCCTRSEPYHTNLYTFDRWRGIHAHLDYYLFNEILLFFGNSSLMLRNGVVYLKKRVE